MPGGALFTFFFSVDLTHVSLAEHDVQLELFLEGRLDEYKGKLNDKKHLSLFESMTGRHGEYVSHWANDLIKDELTMHSKLGDTEADTLHCKQPFVEEETSPAEVDVEGTHRHQ